MTSQDAISLTRDLLRFDTINPPGRERDCAQMAGALLQGMGLRGPVLRVSGRRAPAWSRALGGSDRKAPLCLTGHLDVVPLGSREWSKDPFAGEADGDKLYGRGVSDMKSGVAAILLAARSFAEQAARHARHRDRAHRRRGGRLRRLGAAREDAAARQGGRDGGRRADLELSAGRPQGLAQVPRALQGRRRARLDARARRERDLQGGEGDWQAGSFRLPDRRLTRSWASPPSTSASWKAATR